MDLDPTSQALENMVRANKERIAETERKLQEFQGIAEEITHLIAGQQGISPSEVETFLEKNLSPQLREQAQAQFDEMQQQAAAELPSTTPAVRRPSPGRRLV